LGEFDSTMKNKKREKIKGHDESGSKLVPVLVQNKGTKEGRVPVIIVVPMTSGFCTDRKKIIASIVY
jgi:hypothetical protein